MDEATKDQMIEVMANDTQFEKFEYVEIGAAKTIERFGPGLMIMGRVKGEEDLTCITMYPWVSDLKGLVLDNIGDNYSFYAEFKKPGSEWLSSVWRVHKNREDVE